MSQLFFKKQYQDAIRAGAKCTTIRRWDRPMVRPGRRAFSPGLGWLNIDSVDLIQFEQLDEADACADGFSTAFEMKRSLAEIYPKHESDGKQWFRIRFRVDELQPRRGVVDAPSQLFRDDARS
jgi:hypothetical protein